MTTITDLEVNFEQYKEEQTSIHAEAKEHMNLLQETLNKNKVESDQQFAEIMRVLKTLQSATTAVTVTTTPPPYHSATTIPPSYTTTIPSYTATMPPPQYSLTQPLIFQQYPHPPSAAYTSFSRLHLDSQGYPIPTGSTDNFSGPFSTGEYSNHQNHRRPVSTKGTLSNLGRAQKPEEVQEGIFIKGLKPDLRVAVRTQKPAGVRQAMELALLIDEAGKGGAAKPPNEVGGGVPRTSTGATGAETGKTLFKRMTEAEMADKRAKGLCYRCDGTFGPRHRCPEKILQVLWVGEDEDEEEEGDSFFPP
nr:hypothetical protein [Tanacetum cinerariifolium]